MREGVIHLELGSLHKDCLENWKLVENNIYEYVGSKKGLLRELERIIGRRMRNIYGV